METVLMRPEEAAEAMSISRTTVYDLLRSGELRSIKIGRSRRVTRDALREYIERRELESADFV